MKIDRTKNASRNIIFGSALKIYQMIVPFLMRTAMIYLLGIEYLGLNSLFTSVLQVLNLAELGVGSAMVFSMYKPISEDDTSTICALMQLYKIYYRIIGAVICIIGLILVPFIPKLISGNVPLDINIYALYIMNLGATVLSFWLFAYKNSILQAYQRTDIISKVQLITETVKYILQLVILVVFHNYYYYVMVVLLTQALTNIITAIYADKMYPEYRANGMLPRESISQINGRIRDLFTSRIGIVVINSVDTIVVSAYLGLAALAVYQNYFYLITAAMGFVSVIFNACTAGIGNSLIVESENKNFEDFIKFTFIISWIGGFCTICFLCLFQPFMDIWVGKELMLEFPVVVCFCIYFFVVEINSLLNLYKDAAGIWHADRFRPLVTAIVNIGLNLKTVQFWGLYGVIVSTISSMLLVGMPWLLHNLFTVLFRREHLKNYLKKFLYYVVVTFINSCATFGMCSLLILPKWIEFIVRVVVCFILPNIIFFLAYYKLHEFKQSMILFDKITYGKIRALKKIIG